MQTREQWLCALVDALRPMFAEKGYPLPDRIRVSCGWPSRSGLSAKSRRIGEAWSAKCSSDGTHETFLSPVLADPIDVGAVLVHELVHHAVGVEHGHKGPFKRCSTDVGLVGKMTSTDASPALKAKLTDLCATIGEYPHACLNAAGGKKKQGTRMLKLTCADCGCIVRMSRQAMDTAGTPTCGCGGPMGEDSTKD